MMKTRSICQFQSIACISIFLVIIFSLKAQEPILKPNIPFHQLSLYTTIQSPPLKEKNLSLEFTPVQSDMKFDPILALEKSQNYSEIDNEDISEIKSKKDYLKKAPFNIARTGKNDPNIPGPIRLVLGTRFYGDIDGGCPNDNTIAISKSGRIISMMNQFVGIYNSSGSKLNNYSLESFFNNNMNSGPCDPKVEYDQSSDRFFMFIQDCNTTPEKIAFGFSKTNDPNGNWYIYIFDSDGLGDGSWSDYPKIAINADEIFVSLNLFDQKSGKYNKSILYQLNKTQAYSGLTMNYKIWSGFQNGTILPIRSGDRGLYGPGIYCVQTTAGGASSFNFYNITGKLGDANSKLLYTKVNTPAYEPSGNAYQKNTDIRLDIGDCRSMDGFYQNGIIHWVFSADDAGYSGIRYHRLNPKQLDGNQFEIFSSSDLKDYCYPSISSFSSSSNDNTAIIHFAASGENSFPEMRAKLYHHDFSSDPSILVKQGPGPTTTCYNSDRGSARWGDYSGIARNYISGGPSVWVAGSIGNDISGKWWTYISEIHSEVNAVNNLIQETKIELFPNPSDYRINIVIESKEKKFANFKINNSSGQFLSQIFEGYLYPGRNNFSFSVNELPSGPYFLIISSLENEIIKSERFVVLHN